MKFLSTLCCLLLFSVTHARNEAISKDIHPIFVCNNTQYPTAQLEKTGEKSTSVSGLFGKGQATSCTYKAADGLTFGVDVIEYDEKGWTSVNGWLRNNTGKTMTLDSIIWISKAAIPCQNDNQERLRILNGNTEYYVYDFWNDRLQGVFKNTVEIAGQRPHACSLLAIRPVREGKIQVISSTLHLLQGEKEITRLTNMNTSPFDGARDELWIELTPQALTDGKLVLAAGDGLRVASAQGARSKLEKRTDGLWDLHLWDMKDRVALVLRVR